MKKLFLSSALILSLLMPSCITMKCISKLKNGPKIQQINIIKDGLYDNHNAFVNESNYSLEKILESTELIKSEMKYSITYKDLDGKLISTKESAQSVFTGVVLEKRGGKAYILTAFHSVDYKADLDKIKQGFQSKEPFQSLDLQKIDYKIYSVKENNKQINFKTVASNKELDVALLEADDPKEFKKFPYNIGKSNDLREGDFIWAIGNPLGFLKNYILKGNVSNLNFIDQNEWFMAGFDIQKGYSGGPVIAIRDGAYELVGISIAGLTRNANYLPGEMEDFLGNYSLVAKIDPIMDMVNDYFKSQE